MQYFARERTGARDFKSNISFPLESRSKIILLEFQSIRLFNLSRNVYILRAFIDRHSISINIAGEKTTTNPKKKIQLISLSSCSPFFPFSPSLKSVQESEWNKKNWQESIAQRFVGYASKTPELDSTIQDTITLIVERAARTHDVCVRAIFSSLRNSNSVVCNALFSGKYVREQSQMSKRDRKMERETSTR